MGIAGLIPDSSAKTARIAAAFIIENPHFFDEMFQLAISDKPRLAMRSSNVVFIIHCSHPEIVAPKYDDILGNLMLLTDTSAKRNLLRIFTENTHRVNDDQLGKLTNIAFEFLQWPEAEVAHRVYALSILVDISEKFPEITNELIAVIELQVNSALPAFRAVGKKMIKKLYERNTTL